MLDSYYVDEIVAAVVRAEGLIYLKKKNKSLKLARCDLLDLIATFDKYTNFPVIKESREEFEKIIGKYKVPEDYEYNNLVPKKVKKEKLVEVSNELEMIDYECRLAKGLIKAHHILRYEIEFSTKFIHDLNDGIAKGKKSRVYQTKVIADNLESAFEDKKKDIRINPS